MRSAIFGVLLLGLVTGCGADLSAQLASMEGSLAHQVSNAVWYAEVGEELTFARQADGVLAEDGGLYDRSILLSPPNNGSTYVNGVFYIDVPDEEFPVFRSWVGFPASDSQGHWVTFELLVQEDDRFPSLARVEGASNGHLDELVADLSAYRGKNVVLILASSWKAEEFPADLLWIHPSISNSLR